MGVATKEQQSSRGGGWFSIGAVDDTAARLQHLHRVGVGWGSNVVEIAVDLAIVEIT